MLLKPLWVSEYCPNLIVLGKIVIKKLELRVARTVFELRKSI